MVDIQKSTHGRLACYQTAQPVIMVLELNKNHYRTVESFSAEMADLSLSSDSSGD